MDRSQWSFPIPSFFQVASGDWGIVWTDPTRVFRTKVVEKYKLLKSDQQKIKLKILTPAPPVEVSAYVDAWALSSASEAQHFVIDKLKIKGILIKGGPNANFFSSYVRK